MIKEIKIFTKKVLTNREKEGRIIFVVTQETKM